MPQLENSSPDSFAQKSMHFWGVCCESGKQYAQVVGQRFRITMAVLDPNSYTDGLSTTTVSLLVIRGGIEYLLCVLNHENIPQVNLNLIFDKGENVTFYINGHGRVYLSGYQLTDSVSDVLNDENGFLCPLVEVKSSKSKKEKKKKVSEPEEQSTSDVVSPQSKKNKAPKEVTVWNTFLNKNENGEIIDSDDESDEDYALDEESEDSLDHLDEELLEEEVELFKEEAEELYKEEEDEVVECSDEEENEKELEEPTSTSKKNQKKRKLETSLEFQKRSRKSSGTIEDPVEVQDNGSKDHTSDSDDVMNSSIGNTPMPKKQLMQTSTEKKKKKKKKLNDIANMSSKSDNMQSPAFGNTPRGAQNTPSKKQIFSDVEVPNKGSLSTKIKENMQSPAAVKSSKGAQNTPKKVQKLEGGVEIQDVVTGKGPVATKGKMVHVFYVGRFLDNKIFDSRLPQSKPFSFKLGHNQVIKGWDIGLQGMRVGGKRKLIVPAKMAYGNSSVGNIPPNSTLQFTVELQAVS